MSNLIAFVRARLADDERATRLDSTARNGVESTAGADVLAYVDRALREVEAKGEIIDYCESVYDDGTSGADLAKFIVRTLAAIHSDHPDFRGERRPGTEMRETPRGE